MGVWLDGRWGRSGTKLRHLSSLWPQTLGAIKAFANGGRELLPRRQKKGTACVCACAGVCMCEHVCVYVCM